MKRLFFGLILLAVVFGGGGFGVYVFGKSKLESWSLRSLDVASEQLVDFPRGTALGDLAELLEQKGLISNALYFRLWVRFFSDYSKFQAGLYKYEGTVTPVQIAKKIMDGEIHVPIAAQITIPEGFTLKQIIERMAAQNIATKEALMAVAESRDFRESLNIRANSIEGFLYPATYTFTEMPSPEEALRRPIETFWKRLPDDYEARIVEKGLSLADAVSFASLIELETSHDDERKLVAEVIWRRLKLGMPLGIDAAIIYGIKDYKGDLTFKHLKDHTNPYNTRIHPGLPPTAIGSPSLASLLAILDPAREKNLYYVLDAEQGDRHHFSKTLREHNKWVRKLKRASRGGKRP